MYTFSQMVDSIQSEVRRSDLTSDIASYLNQTLRELHFSADNNAALFFSDNFVEESLTATVEEAQTWEISHPTRFQGMSAVKYSSVTDRDGDALWPPLLQPGRIIKDFDEYYYRTGQTFVFAGYGGIGGVIGLGYYEFPRSLKYYPDDATRPAEYDEDDGWTYPAGAASAEDQLAARNQVSNWLLLKWSDVIAEGIRAKVYKRLSDTERARTCYGLYGALRQGLWTSESASFSGG